MCFVPICFVQVDLYISAYKQLISRGAGSKLEYVLERWLICVNMIKSPFCSEEWVIDIGSFNIALTPCSIRYPISVG